MIEKMDMKSMDITEKNVKKIQALFPNAVTEVIVDGKTTLKIDFDVLKQELSANLIEDKQERYQMTWPDKSKAKVLASSRITSTLRPDKEKSVDFDNTQNLYIEGDNLDVLKLLRETYLGKVKMIYIDPPYNTGNDFVYNDDFSQSADEYMETSGQYDEEGNRLMKNLESNGRFHTDWLNMIYPRLKVAKDLLSDDGVIFISIDDHEVENLIKVADEIFGRKNRLAVLVWKKKYTGGKGTSTFADYHEYILSYSKNVDSLGEISMARPDEEKGKFVYEDEYLEERGRYYTRPLKSNLDPRPTLVYPIDLPDGGSVTTQWICAKDTFEQLKKEGRIEFKSSATSKYPVYKKFYEKDGGGNIKIPSFIEVSNNNEAKEELKELFGIYQTRDLPFQTPKPVKLLELFILNFTKKDEIVLDFFSGSASTAHAVFTSNLFDGSHRKFILVQLPEGSDIRGQEYETICDIGEERIRRAGAKIKEESGLTADKLDTGFRVLKLDSSNMQDVYYNPMAMRQSLLDGTIDNVKTDRTPLDLLFQVMLDLGVELSAKIEEKQVNGKTYFVVNGNDLIACFDEDIDNDVITEIAKQQPLYAVFKSTSFATDSASINNEQLFKTYSPSTVIKVI